ENLRLRAKLELAARERRRIGVFRGIERLRNVRRFAEFAERHLTIVEKEQGVLVPFRLNWIQRAILAAELRARRARRKPRFVVLKYRRGGVTTLAQGLCYHTVWSTEHSAARTFAHRKEDTATIFEMVKRFHDHQPP